jgi:hypothetical protein
MHRRPTFRHKQKVFWNYRILVHLLRRDQTKDEATFPTADLSTDQDSILLVFGLHLTNKKVRVIWRLERVCNFV